MKAKNMYVCMALAVVMLMVGILAAAVAFHEQDWEKRHPINKQHRLIALCNETKSCIGAFVRWDNASKIVRLGSCGQKCGALEADVSTFRYGPMYGFYTNMDSLVLPNNVAWVWTAIQYEQQFTNKL